MPKKSLKAFGMAVIFLWIKFNVIMLKRNMNKVIRLILFTIHFLLKITFKKIYLKKF